MSCFHYTKNIYFIIFAGLELIFSPRKTIECMAEEDQKKLVSWLFLKTCDWSLRDNNNSELPTEAYCRHKIPNHTEGIYIYLILE